MVFEKPGQGCRTVEQVREMLFLKYVLTEQLFWLQTAFVMWDLF